MPKKSNKGYKTYDIMPELMEITRLTSSEGAFNSELETFEPYIQKRILKVMRDLMKDEMAFVLSLENFKRKDTVKYH
ncbi:hypothetical protein CIL03_08465 [Virgibacillus indicus]|uniref:Uncharacterized protein n=1 Tax=Virgibacillus indicus TaxID=2024554 RepID=A0A265NB47_9BACI|nr:hypothetical protein [Virgibacillus indicus]OZU89041.1 hypothetical protein CIL03_08465 [Virgibacillus indicus]